MTDDRVKQHDNNDEVAAAMTNADLADALDAIALAFEAMAKLGAGHKVLATPIGALLRETIRRLREGVVPDVVLDVGAIELAAQHLYGYEDVTAGVACPLCGAAIGTLCTVTPPAKMHFARYRAYYDTQHPDQSELPGYTPGGSS